MESDLAGAFLSLFLRPHAGLNGPHYRFNARWNPLLLAAALYFRVGFPLALGETRLAIFGKAPHTRPHPAYEPEGPVTGAVHNRHPGDAGEQGEA